MIDGAILHSLSLSVQVAAVSTVLIVIAGTAASYLLARRISGAARSWTCCSPSRSCCRRR